MLISINRPPDFSGSARRLAGVHVHQAPRTDRAQAAGFTRLGAAAHLVQVRTVAWTEADLARDLGSPHSRRNIPRLLHRQSHRLLAVEMLAGLGHRQGLLMMQEIGRGHHHGIYVTEKLPEVGHGPPSDFLSQELRPVCRRVGNGHHPGSARFGAVAGVAGSIGSGADDADLDHSPHCL
jgi:hypothetical protein